MTDTANNATVENATVAPQSAIDASPLGAAWIGFNTLLRKEIVRILRIWGQTLLPSVITTTLYFIIFGPILGRRIGTMEGYSYLQYVTPGLIMMAVITNAYANVVSSFFGAKFQHHVEEMLVAPMSSTAILWGHAMGGVFRGGVVGVLVAIVSLLFTHLTVRHLLLTITVALLTALTFSIAGLINAIVARNFDDVSIVPTFVLTPLTMLGGVFYSVQLLPDIWRQLSYANPILYMVNAFRFAILGQSDIGIGTSLMILTGFLIAFYVIAYVLLVRGTGIRT
jgi:ABC-2 type transport system permease protein